MRRNDKWPYVSLRSRDAEVFFDDDDDKLSLVKIILDSEEDTGYARIDSSRGASV